MSETIMKDFFQIIQIHPDISGRLLLLQILRHLSQNSFHALLCRLYILPNFLPVAWHQPVHSQCQACSNQDQSQLIQCEIQAVIRRHQVMCTHYRIDRNGILPVEKTAAYYHQQDIYDIVHPPCRWKMKACINQPHAQEKGQNSVNCQLNRILSRILYSQKGNDPGRCGIGKTQEFCRYNRHTASSRYFQRFQ